jgi:hypothetical protein
MHTYIHALSRSSSVKTTELYCFTEISKDTYTYIHIHTYIYNMCICIYTYIHIHIHTDRGIHILSGSSSVKTTELHGFAELSKDKPDVKRESAGSLILWTFK